MNEGVSEMELDNGMAVSISLVEDSSGKDRVSFALSSGECDLNLSPHQARVLATELIMAVNRAEVRGNLRRSQNLARSAESSRNLFHQAFAK
jgi:histidine ammonia-lyase